ncbi:hypothetical protein F5Y06DRAFT_298493 [Hypoxylon sp. FL0890]|nr:hypothetical protein F5Y06DRAFT_298493 [Hypoxylon sp. FL0890]
MDSSTGLGFHQIWSTRKDSIVAKHKSDLALQEELLEKEEQELRSTNESNLQKLKAILPSAIYRDTVLPMAEKSLKHDLQELEASHRKRLRFIEKSHMEELARHEVDHHGSHMEELARQEKLRVNSPGNERLPAAMDSIPSGLPEAAEAQGSWIPQPQDVSIGPDRPEKDHRPMSWNAPASPNPDEISKLCKPLTCTVQPEIICGERRLIMRVQSKKRNASVSKELPLKRLRLDTSVNPLRTPAPTPSNDSTHPPERTVTFDEVYQGGKAKHKDTIVEWPVGSRKWYILKCEKHGLRFTRNAVQGAAKHLNGLNHGFPDRNREVAVRTLGYLVVDCNESLAKLNNSVAEEAYANGYKPSSSKSKNRTNKVLERQKKEGRESTKSLPSYANSVPGSGQGIASTPEKPGVGRGVELGTPSSHQKSLDSWNGITDPKTFHIYYGHWKGTGHRKGSDQIYPVMILGWDRQNGSGLKDTDLNDTGLLKKNSQPPNCYIYDSNRIVGWAPGYEDGGPKIRLRKFPVMFFDESQTVAWLPARDLMEFPLYKRKAPDQPDHPFNAARRWIAEREGFKTWEDREKARIDSLTARAPSPSPLTPVEDSSNTVSRAGERDGLPSATKPDLLADSEDSESSGSEVESTSVGTADTERLLEDLRERGGEITGDDDYSGSDSEIDETLDCELDDWNQSNMSAARPDNNAVKRPWAFYGLRSTENAKESKLPVIPGDVTQDSFLVAGGMDSARRLARQACHLSGAYSSIADSQETLRTAAESKEDVPNAMRGPSQSDRPPSGDESSLGGARFEHDELVETIKRTLGFFAQDDYARTPTESQRPPSQRFEPGTRHAAAMQPTSENRAASALQAKTSGVTPPEENLEVDAEGRIMDDRQLLVKDRQGAAQKENEPSQRNREYADEAVEQSEKLWRKVRIVSPSSKSPIAMNVPTPVMSPAGGSADSEFLPTRADFELSLYSNGDVSWEKSGEQESCIQLFHSADRKVIASRRGPVGVTINPMEIFGFSREELAGSDKILFILKNKDGSSSRLIFDRSRGSKLGNGKVQVRGFIKWLRDVNPAIDCLEP